MTLAHRGEFLQNTLRILQRVSLHVIMRSKGQKVMQGDDVCGDLESDSKTVQVTVFGLASTVLCKKP